MEAGHREELRHPSDSIHGYKELTQIVTGFNSLESLLSVRNCCSK